jgi:hypothetical protein
VLLLKPYDEFAAHMYQKSDTNKDGILTVTEIEDEFRQYDANRMSKIISGFTFMYYFKSVISAKSRYL